MATLPKFLERIQSVDGRDHGTMQQFGRVLREAGYIPAGKRGKGAPDMQLEHAANLLLGTYGAASPKDGPKAVENLRTLVPWAERKGDFHQQCVVFKNILAKATFGEAIEELISGVPNIAQSFVRMVDPDCNLSSEEEAELRLRFAKGMGPVDVKVTLGPTNAFIKIVQVQKPIWTLQYMIDVTRMGEYTDVMNADRKPMTEFSIRTLSAFFAALMEGLE